MTNNFALSSNLDKLDRNFYIRDVLTVARELLGKILVKNDGDKIYTGRIVEVEAYNGAIDEAAHTFAGRTPRNEIMFGIGGYLYVYFTYGMYFCSNIVTGKEGHGEAVLLRGLEPLEGLEYMGVNRFGKNVLTDKELMNLTNGPGKLCKALDIERKNNGTDLLGDNICLVDQKKVPENKIAVSTRIGISRSIDLPWRFYVKDNPYVSRKK